MSSNLKDTSMDKLVARNSEYHYYSLPRAAKQLGEDRPAAEVHEILLENLCAISTAIRCRLRIYKRLLTGSERDTPSVKSPTGPRARADAGLYRRAGGWSIWRRCVRRCSGWGGDVDQVNPLSPVDLVIDHSVTVDEFGDQQAFGDNVRIEMQRNHERYTFSALGTASL
ncbi:Aconitate hydratase 1 [Serratia rubidaea]|uniref:Aconitate hydratase 1 n=1 Tax=Serratia rubidaea TaxID=61652 RepID=A0A4U9HHF4_SERRU|nr:Aconitate hydratase 1 [Serratia rubidaea]